MAELRTKGRARFCQLPDEVGIDCGIENYLFPGQMRRTTPRDIRVTIFTQAQYWRRRRGNIMNDIKKLIRLDESRETEALEILTDAFAGDPLFKRAGTSRKTIAKMFRRPLMTGFQYGDVFAVDGKLESLMITTPSDKIHIAFQQFVRHGLLGSVLEILPMFFKKETWPLLRALLVIEKDKKKLDIGPYVYLYLLAIHQSGQGKGLGSFLMKSLCEQADEQNKAVYLETQTHENVRFYEKFGFETLKEIPIDKDYSLWEMVRFAKGNKPVEN